MGEKGGRGEEEKKQERLEGRGYIEREDQKNEREREEESECGDE